jgi:hypothetical protein
MISTLADLTSALATAKPGDVLTLAQGQFERLALEKVQFEKRAVVINGPGTIVAGVELSECAGLTFRGLEVTINQRTQTAINVVGSRRVRLEKLDIHGEPGGDKPGVMFRHSHECRLSGSRLHDLGTAVRLIDCEGVRVASNGFRNLRGDGVQSSGSSKVSITGNRFTDFYPGPGDHPDAIQFFTVNQKAPARDVIITGNVIQRGKGGIVQGIFLGNETGLPYINVNIARNVCLGTMWNGVAVGQGERVLIADNLVQPFTEGDVGSGIVIDRCVDVAVRDNWAGVQRLGAQTNLTETGNRAVTPATGGKTLLAVWRKRRA